MKCGDLIRLLRYFMPRNDYLENFINKLNMNLLNPKYRYI